MVRAEPQGSTRFFFNLGMKAAGDQTDDCVLMDTLGPSSCTFTSGRPQTLFLKVITDNTGGVGVSWECKTTANFCEKISSETDCTASADTLRDNNAAPIQVCSSGGTSNCCKCIWLDSICLPEDATCAPSATPSISAAPSISIGAAPSISAAPSLGMSMLGKKGGGGSGKKGDSVYGIMPLQLFGKKGGDI
jgi:hypothetical protein